jgi:hypothetical protein
MNGNRTQLILETLTAELDRQSPGREGGPIDLMAVARAIDVALDGTGQAIGEEGQTPQELNAENDG